MSAPRVEKRRKKEFAAELLDRARVWIPDWELDPAARDFGMALLDIAARFDSEVAERLDRAGEKNQRGLLDWLGIQGEAARAARVPVVLLLGEQTPAPVVAKAPVKLRADTAGGPVVFETETDLTLVPGRLATLVAVDPAGDAFFLPPPGIDNVEPQPVLPDSWRTKTFAAGGAATLQLDPELGLAADMLVQVNGLQYRIAEVDKDLVTLEPPLGTGAGVDANTLVNKVTTFAPFDGPARNRQRHALYVGDDELLNITASATIAVAGLSAVPEGAAWEYWGKAGEAPAVGWQALLPASSPPGARFKRQGSLEPYALHGIESRWIRAVIDTQPGSASRFDQLQLQINPSDDELSWPFPAGGVTPAIEGVANTAPQMLDGVFYPFGREPRLFDTFYLGCAEAFSKKSAKVAMYFDLADPTMKALTAVPTVAGDDSMLAAVGQDGSLHLFTVSGDGKAAQWRPALKPPSPADGGTNVSKAPVTLDRQQDDQRSARPAAWTGATGFYVAVAARSQVWVWHEDRPGAQNQPSSSSGWIAYGEVGTDPKTLIDDLVVAGPASSLFALRSGIVYWRDPAAAAWSVVPLEGEFAQAPYLATLAPVRALDANSNFGAAESAALCAISKDGAAYIIWVADGAGRCAKLPWLRVLSTRLRPVAWLTTPDQGVLQLQVVALTPDQQPQQLEAFQSEPFTAATRPLKIVKLRTPSLEVGAVVIGRDLDALATDQEARVLMSAADAVMAATPFAGQPTIEKLAIEAGTGVPGGAPVVAGTRYIVLPGTRSDLLVGTLDQAERITVAVDDEAFSDVLVADAALALEEDDSAAFRFGGANKVECAIIGRAHFAGHDKEIYRLSAAPETKPSSETPYWLFKTSRPGLRARRAAGGALRIADPDNLVEKDAWLLLQYDGDRLDCDVHKVSNDPQAGSEEAPDRLVQFTAPVRTQGTVICWVALAGEAAMLPLLTLDANSSAGWSAALLQSHPIHFPGLSPEQQLATELEADGRVRRLLLPKPFSQRPGQAIRAYVEATGVAWHRHLGETADNPELSWEYWNGRGWWKLDLDSDATANFQRSGLLKLTVPDDLQASEWAGKTNFWIRARLVGGDYGREKVVARTEPVDKGTAQTIERDPSAIHAPAVLLLELRYATPAITPTHVLTEDSATVRNQSAANRTSGAVVEAFLPLAEMLGRLDAAAAQAAAGCCDGCAGTPAAAAATPAASAAAGRAFYLGFDARLKGEPVNILLLPGAEQNFDNFAPARVDVLRGTRFEPVVAADATRALGEAGILSLALASAPAPAELFGRTLAWLRIRPRDGSPEQDWMPALRGAYLNAVWARAAETQEFEMLGSSSGAPLQQVLLARPPLLRDSLELRVREPLGEEERIALLQEDPDKVRSAVAGQPGDWVLWKRVVDPADEDARARVYGLDEASGTIWFGDGVHGAIAPIGRDAIMAFRYRRTEAPVEAGGPVPANTVAAGSSLSIVTPVQGAEAAFAADHAAGGVPAEDSARVLRLAPAHLRQRGAAVTGGDLEDMALSLVPEAAQACCLRHGAALQLVLVMQGADPRPGSALKRQLRRMLLDAAPPALAAPGAFAIIDPRPVPFYVRVPLATATLDTSASLAAAAKRAIAALFDSAGGGSDGQGWPLGARPSETDIAACLLDLPHVDNVGQVELTEHDAGGVSRPLRGALAATELAQLAADGIELLFVLPQEAS